MPSAEPGTERLPRGPVPRSRRFRRRWAFRIPNVEGYARRGRARPARPDLFQLEWIDACKGKNNNVVHGTSSKTHCDFDYSGTMIEQMLLGLVAHRAGKKLEYDPATGRVTNAPEAND